MPNPNPDPNKNKKLADLAGAAAAALNQLLALEALESEQWRMRLSVGGSARNWETLTKDSATNDRLIKEKIEQSEKPVSELALAYVGMVDWRGSKKLMAYLQYYRAGEDGLLCLRNVKEGSQAGTFEGFGGLMIAGACKNIWI